MAASCATREHSVGVALLAAHADASPPGHDERGRPAVAARWQRRGGRRSISVASGCRLSHPIKAWVDPAASVDDAPPQGSRRLLRQRVRADSPRRPRIWSGGDPLTIASRRRDLVVDKPRHGLSGCGWRTGARGRRSPCAGHRGGGRPARPASSPADKGLGLIARQDARATTRHRAAQRRTVSEVFLWHGAIRKRKA